MHYPRRLLPTLQRQLHTRLIVVLTGMRRVGKTTLYRMLFDQIKSANKVFLDMENPIERKIFEERDYNNIWANLSAYGITTKEKAYIFLDEVQLYPEIVQAIKYLYDHYAVKFFLTGSSSFYFKNLFPESLAGRKVVFELFPLDFEEFLVFKEVGDRSGGRSLAAKEKSKNDIVFERTKMWYEEYLTFGGFPEVVLTDSHEQKRHQLDDIFTSYFEKDVRSLAHVREISVFRDLLLLLLRRAGSKLEITKLASEVGVARETVYSYLAFLAATYFIFLVPPFSRSVDREVSGAKKVYICDTGILHHFARVDDGSLFENAVFLNLRKYGELCYYQRRTGAEIDFILRPSQTAVEVKERGTPPDQRQVQRLAQSLELKNAYVVTRHFNPERGFLPALSL